MRRLFMNTADISIIKGCGIRQAQIIYNDILQATGKTKTIGVTFEDFASYFLLKKEDVINALK
jgi:hypothetical protein